MLVAPPGRRAKPSPEDCYCPCPSSPLGRDRARTAPSRRAAPGPSHPHGWSETVEATGQETLPLLGAQRPHGVHTTAGAISLAPSFHTSMTYTGRGHPGGEVKPRLPSVPIRCTQDPCPAPKRSCFESKRKGSRRVLRPPAGPPAPTRGPHPPNRTDAHLGDHLGNRSHLGDRCWHQQGNPSTAHGDRQPPPPPQPRPSGKKSEQQGSCLCKLRCLCQTVILFVLKQQTKTKPFIHILRQVRQNHTKKLPL